MNRRLFDAVLLAMKVYASPTGARHRNNRPRPAACSGSHDAAFPDVSEDNAESALTESCNLIDC